MPPALIAVAVALLFSMRVIGAGVLAPHVDGFVPICSGGEIIYVAIDSGNPAPAPDAPDHKSAPCSWVGLGMAALSGGFDAVIAPELLDDPAPITKTDLHGRPVPAMFQPRAPPVMLA